jgi:PAS domain S-box-containing protein
MSVQIAQALAARFIELRDRENAIAEELTAYKELVDFSPCPMMLTTKDGVVVYVNKSYCAMLGVRAEDVVVNGWYRLVAKRDLDRVKTGWEEAVRAGMQDVASHVVFDLPGKGEMVVYWKAKMLRDNGYAIVLYHPSCRFLETDPSGNLPVKPCGCGFYGV